jgi:uracil phosphoribosyltransferase
VVKVISHPLLKHKLTILRDEQTSSQIFREVLVEIVNIMSYPIFESLETILSTINTPVSENYQGCKLKNEIIIIPILRAGLVIGEQLSKLLPQAKIGHIGLFRDPKTLNPSEYFFKLPPFNEKDTFFVVDVMLATGGSAKLALSKLFNNGAKNLNLLCLVASPEGIKVIESLPFPITIYTLTIDDRLNEKGYIIPGLGDAGDRIFGTK